MKAALKPIYTKETNCSDCYKCIRECPAKAIRVTDHKASIIDDLCLYCGHCVEICPNEAKKVRNDVGRVKELLKDDQPVIVSLAPSYKSEFPGFTDFQIIRMLRSLGFASVSETAIGATIISDYLRTFLTEKLGGVHISSACPAVVELICKYYPQYIENLTPCVSPMVAHAQLLKKIFGKDARIVFIGPCIAKKLEGDENPQLIDAAITFNELKTWFEENENVEKEDFEPVNETFVPYKAGNACLYPVDGGMIETLKGIGHRVTSISFSGISQVKDALDNLEQLTGGGTCFLELLMCSGGCTNGPGTSVKGGIPFKRVKIIEQEINDGNKPGYPAINIACNYIARNSSIGHEQYSELEIEHTLQSIGKYTAEELLNCSGCGYDSCRDFAIAMLQGKGEPEMCVSYMRRIAQNKATVLLQKIPSGVVVVDNAHKVVEMNASCARLLGEEVQLMFEASPGLQGANVEVTCFLSDYIKTALATGKEYTEQLISHQNISYQLSVFNIEKYRLVTAIVQTLQNPRFKQHIIANKTRDVIKRNMETVQKIASLLGENAAYTDSLLSSIIQEEGVRT